ncbi:MAG: membrane protein insertion efficiency factor YidD [Desulfovibrionaceae bacterium]|nr:membrane protein insertion efficiency factor YidD [Desulfovibrionaceae bacterium]
MMTAIGILLIRIYQLFLSPLLPQRCRFYPSCSQYALDALRQHTFMRAVSLILYRLGRCHPWCDGGYDPVPTSKNNLEN